MADQDKTGVPGHEVPPPRPLPPPVIPAIGAVVLDVAALITVYYGRCNFAAILIAIAILLGGYVVYSLLSSPSDKSPVDGHEPPPP